MDPKLIAAARATFPAGTDSIVLGAPVRGREAHPEPLVRVPLAMLSRHGLVAGATGTGKTKTLQLIAEQLSHAGVPVFLADLKGDLAGIAAPGEASERVKTRATETGFAWQPRACPVELFCLSGGLGAQVRATVSSFGPLLLARVLDLNPTQTSVLSLVFKYCDDRGLELLDFTDLRTVLQHLTGAGAGELATLGGMSKASVGVLLREMVELEQQGALAFFGEPELELPDLLRVTPDGNGIVSVLELQDVQDKPALFSTFMMWLLARLFAELPELGDPPKPRLVFFFDEAHLLFRGASPAFLDQVTTLGTGEALISALAPNGAPTQPFATRLIPPASRMGVLTELELRWLVATPQVQKYRRSVDRESAHEKLTKRTPSSPPESESAAPPAVARNDGVSMSEILNSPLARTVANAFTRGVLGALLGSPRRRRR